MSSDLSFDGDYIRSKYGDDPVVARFLDAVIALRDALATERAGRAAAEISIARLEMALTLELNSLDTMLQQLQRNKEGLERVLAAVDALGTAKGDDT